MENSHPAIVEPEVFDLVQYELQRWQESGFKAMCGHPFSGKIFCGICGDKFGSKVWHSNDPQYRRTVWQCNSKYRAGERCRAPHLTEEQVQAAFLTAFNQRLQNREAIFAAYDEVMKALTDTAELDAESARITEECEVVMELTRKCVQENAASALDQADYNQRYTALVARYDAARARLGEIDLARHERRAKRTNINSFLRALRKEDDLVAEWDEELWYTTVDRLEVCADGTVRVVFRDGEVVEVAEAAWRAAA